MLAEHFDPKVVKKNPKGYHYLAIDTVQDRLDDVLGPKWSMEVVDSSVQVVNPEWKKYGSNNPKTGFLATVVVRIDAQLATGTDRTVRTGVGADFADDADKAYKTALANAVKKAANGFGVGRYLWSAEERAAIDEAVEAANDVKALKKAVVALAKNQGAMQGQPWDGMSPADKQELLAKHFGVSVEDLASAETLNKILGDA